MHSSGHGVPYAPARPVAARSGGGGTGAGGAAPAGAGEGITGLAEAVFVAAALDEGGAARSALARGATMSSVHTTTQLIARNRGDCDILRC